jgi:lysophospholipase L1-like esterase
MTRSEYMKSKIELKPNQTIVFIGDSITDAERMSAAYKPFGAGYVHFTANALLAKYPQLNLNIINSGVSGNTIHDLKTRWQRDCISHKPDILSILIGVNDIWRRIAENDPSGAADLDEYDSMYRQLISQTKKECNSRIVIIEPFMFCDDLNNPVFVELRRFVEKVRTIAADFNAVLVPLQKAIDERIKEVPPQNWSLDMVHPEVWAHAWISQRWLEVTGL